jgi:hypothetical protein
MNITNKEGSKNLMRFLNSKTPLRMNSENC